MYAVSLGGDTETIGAMPGVISVTYYNDKNGITQSWLDVQENGK